MTPIVVADSLSLPHAEKGLSQLATLFSAALKAPEVKSKLAAQELYPVGTCGAEFGAYLRKQSNEYGRIIREANIKGE